jgi:hypothetical protein
MNPNPKLTSILSIILLLSCFIIAFSSAVTSAYEVKTIANGPIFGSSSDLATPTPTPTATPTPTTQPTPTPRPEPSAKPTLQMTLTSTATSNNPKVTVSGTLTYNHTGIEGAPIYAAFSADCGNIWQNFSLVQTHADGSFSTVWVPNATGNYLVSTQWDGNLTLHWLNTTASLALTADSDGNEFSVTSNSTIIDLAYDSASRQLRFQTNGTTNTIGYLNVCVPKTLAADAQALQLKIDGTTQTFSSQSQNDVWVISCTYTQSTHNFVVQLPAEVMFSPIETPWVMIAIAVVVVIAVIAVLIVVRRRRRTAATVAEILKDKRPVF